MLQPFFLSCRCLFYGTQSFLSYIKSPFIVNPRQATDKTKTYEYTDTEESNEFSFKEIVQPREQTDTYVAYEDRLRIPGDKIRFSFMCLLLRI